MDAIKEFGKKKVPVIAVDEQELRAHVSEVVLQSVEQTLNGLLEAEADALCQARRYERNAQRASTRAGHYQRDLQTKAGTVQLSVPKLRHVPFETAIKAASVLESGCDETLSYYAFPATHWRHIRTSNPLERLNREIRRRTRVVGRFPDGHAALMLVSARLRYMAGQKWGTQRYI